MSKELAQYEEQPQGITLDVQEVANALQNAVNLAALVERRFKEGHHFMHIPGTPRTQRPHLCDPGASLIAAGYHVRPEYRVLESIHQGDEISVALECTYIHIPTETKVTAGVGTATTQEVKYAYRWVQRADVPADMALDSVPTRERRGDRVKLYRIDNPDIGDLYNTIWKMAAKRAEGDAVLKLPGCSELFAGYRIDPVKAQQQAQDETPAPPSVPSTPAERERDSTDLIGDGMAKPQTGEFPNVGSLITRATSELGYADGKAVCAALGVENPRQILSMHHTLDAAWEALCKAATAPVSPAAPPNTAPGRKAPPRPSGAVQGGVQEPGEEETQF